MYKIIKNIISDTPYCMNNRHYIQIKLYMIENNFNLVKK